ncbi:hypothetical protein JOQ06_020966, partial [Pogonophryne albipinna]
MRPRRREEDDEMEKDIQSHKEGGRSASFFAPTSPRLSTSYSPQSPPRPPSPPCSLFFAVDA